MNTKVNNCTLNNTFFGAIRTIFVSLRISLVEQVRYEWILTKELQ
jgi:hypothetical protein